MNINKINLEEVSEAFRNMRQFLPYERDQYYLQAQKNCSKQLQKLDKLYFHQDEKRNKLFKKLFAQYGENNTIKEGFICNVGRNIRIGNNCFFNFNVVILDAFEIEIGNNVFIAPNVTISAVTHSVRSEERRLNRGGKIVIEDDVWIGAGAIILPNVTLHKGCVIGAGSVVRHDVAPNTVVAGVPAKVIRNIDNQ